MRLGPDFYRRDVLEVAPALLGKLVCHVTGDGKTLRGRVTEVEAYRGEQDTACHARVGRTKRTEPLYHVGGCAYVYLCYGIHRLMNVVTGPQDMPQAVLLRGLADVSGPGRLTRALGVELADNLTDLTTSSVLWLEDDAHVPQHIDTTGRIGIGYASAEDQARPWRWVDRSGDPGGAS
ncbi:MAG: DNA-3-methyladenine glycosylase [Propionibacteriaceae bacterium]|jgi:DNA-3-methyladenine glycosylase|nr:DNA-3-methyladenine glycosylase [Propionibacteriaceae bacterium]